MEKISFRVAEYEGPLDLLLHLITKHKLNIWDIEIAALLEQYLAYIRQRQEQSLEVASDFLEMASRLIYIKTLSLLPKYEDEEEKAKAELVGQLVEYQACKLAAAQLAARNNGDSLFVRPAAPFEVDQSYRLCHEAVVLARAYLDAAGKGRRRLPPRQETFSPLVAKPVVSVTSRIMFLLRGLYKGAQMRFVGLFDESRSRSEMVATFLAVLELVKSKRISVDDDAQGSITFHRDRRVNQTGGEEDPLAE